jgi:hypothetical protein
MRFQRTFSFHINLFFLCVEFEFDVHIEFPEWLITLVVSGLLALLLNSCASFNKRQEQIGRRYWQNAINTKEYKKHYSPGNPKLVRTRY